MSLGDRLREMLDPGASAPRGGGPGPRSRRPRTQAEPLSPVRSYEAEPPRQMARAQWIGLGLAAALAVALTAGLVFAILTITRPGDTRATPAATAVAASPTTAQSIASIFATATPASAAVPTATPLAQPVGQRLQVANTGGDGANLRREPGQDGDRLKTLPDGTAVEVVGPDREVEGRVWRNVRDGLGESGWIIGSLLVPEGTAPPAVAAVPGSSSSTAPAASTPAAPRPTSATTTGAASRGQVGQTGGQGANIRSEPGSNGRVLKTLPEGATIEVLGPEREVDGRIWRQVRDAQGVTGWIVGGAVAPAGSVPTPTPGAARPTSAPSTSGTPGAGPTAAPAATKPAGTGPQPTAAPAKPTTPPGNLPIIIQPATPLPKPGGSPAPR